MKLKTKIGNKGFTLIELLVVVLIIGILASIAVPQYFRVVEKGRAAEAVNMMGAIRGSQERYILKNNSYSNSYANLDQGTFNSNLFTINNTITIGGNGSNGTATYSVFMTRNAGPNPYGNYNVTYNYNQGNGVGTYSSDVAAATRDLLP